MTVNAKIFLQQLWQAKVEWDEAIADDLLAQWKTIHASLATINGLHVDRWVRYGSDTANCELHGFCDASTTAFAAAVYIRVTSVTGETTSRLLIAKSKVAPIKSLSIPRLELSAAVLLARLLEFVRSSLQLTTIPCFCWTDALVVLAWVTQHPSKWKTFVANRVSEIQSRVPFATWRHVSTEDNPADCASRGILGCHLASHHLWWQGPSWLRRLTIEWPAQREPSSHDTTLEQNPRVTTHIVKPVEKWDLAARYSSWPKLIRVTAYILRFASRTRRIETNVNEASPLALSADECRLARDFWLRRIQEEEFPGEREALLSQKTISSKSALISLNPFIGEDKLIREAGVRSVKHHLRRVVGAHTLTFEEFATLLRNIEACLNSRPLAPLTDSADEYEALTPGHFLIGAALTASPEASVLHLNENRLSRWQVVRQTTERFWKLWQTDYVNTLQQRAKWRKSGKEQIRVGQLVLLQNPLLPPCKWELGRIIQCHAGSDNVVRVVTVKTAPSEFKRPVVKICVLPIDIENAETPA
ncbi:uncharacterized protein [Temnothorax longispinosus]|uniref:uncharacterized protein n=1 Tax=Temnothorax longispinosus TaxID=300112 RepID=UPI003A991C16